MKTLAYYENLRDAYMSLSNPSVTAQLLIETLEDLIALYQEPAKDLPLFLGVPVDLPPGWRILIDDIKVIRLIDNYDLIRGVIHPCIQGGYNINWDKEYLDHRQDQVEAIKFLMENIKR